MQIRTLTLIVLQITAMALPVEGRADMVVYDRITSVGTPVFLKVLTKGRLFTQGGRRVQIRLGDLKPQTTLSGGDGLAYVKIQPKQEGRFEIEAVSGSERHRGHLLVVKADAGALIIGIENALRDSLFSDLPKSGSASALLKLAQRHPIVYVTEWLNTGLVKEWLDREKFPPSVVLRWQGTDTLDQLKRQRVSVTAVIGSDAMLKAARQKIGKRYGFEKTRYGEPVSGWREILEKLEIPDK